MIAMPDPTHVQRAARGGRRTDGGGVARMFADVLRPSASPTRATRATCCAAPCSARTRWASTTSSSAPSSSTSCSATRAAPRSLDEGGYFDLTTLDAGSDVRRDTVLALEKLGIDVEYSHHEVGPSQHEIDMRYADALKMADDCMTYRITVKEYRAQVRLARDLHAQAAVRPERLRHAHAPVAVQGRPQRVLRRRRQVLPVGHRQGVHRRPAPPRARDLLDLRPVGELLQAARARLRGAGLRRLEPPQPLSARARPALPPRQGAGDADGAALPRSRLQPVPDVRGAAAWRASRASSAATSCPSRWRRTSTT